MCRCPRTVLLSPASAESGLQHYVHCDADIVASPIAAYLTVLHLSNQLGLLLTIIAAETASVPGTAPIRNVHLPWQERM